MVRLQQMGGPPPQMGPGGGMRPGVGPGGPQMNQPPPGMGQRGPMGGAPPPSGPPQPLMGRPVAAPPNVGGAGFPAGAHINPNVYPGYGQQQGSSCFLHAYVRHAYVCNYGG